MARDALFALASAVQAIPVGVELLLADVSGSLSIGNFELQRDGNAAAFLGLLGLGLAGIGFGGRKKK